MYFREDNSNVSAVDALKAQRNVCGFGTESAWHRTPTESNLRTPYICFWPDRQIGLSKKKKKKIINQFKIRLILKLKLVTKEIVISSKASSYYLN